ncbi:MAG: hypothetical protein VYD71_01050 [Bacteroidota bacterium]|nr:hypothetical protein [Bacteroidota bacterium]
MRILLILSVCCFFACQRVEVKEYKSYLNHHDTIRYIGKETCKQCHLEIYKSFMQTGMGQSLRPAIKAYSALANTVTVIHDEDKNLFYEPFWKKDSLWLHEFQLKGKDTTHSLKRKINYIIGSGHHTNSHLFEENGYLHQIPYTYYTQEKVADLPPGFEKGNNSRFSRKICLECVTCHNANPTNVEGSTHKYTVIPNGIDCERCHGPGEAHLKQIQSGNWVDTSKYIDYSIVNPGKLPLDLQFDVCQRCHLQGTAILSEGKSFTDFKPGQHLKEVMDVYIPKYEGDESFIMASHVERLKESACFKAGEMSCISCHDPHKSVRTTTVTYFDNKCMQCHEMCKEEEYQNDCASCHMPASSSTDIPHVSITDHKIGIHHKKVKTGKGAFLGLFAINNDNPNNLSKAKAYLKRFESFEPNPIYLDSAFKFLQLSSNNYTSFIAYYYLRNKNKELINFVMSNKLNDNKYSCNDMAMAYIRIGETYVKEGLNIDAEKFYKLAIQLMPYEIDYKIKYGSYLLNTDKKDDAFIVFTNALELNPTIKETHLNLGYIALLNAEFEKANNSLNKAIALDPNYVLAYENLVLSAQMQNNIVDVKRYLKKILEIAPNHKAKEILQNF